MSSLLGFLAPVDSRDVESRKDRCGSAPAAASIFFLSLQQILEAGWGRASFSARRKGFY